MSSNTVTKSGLYVVSLIEALWVVLLAVVLLASLVLFVVHHVYAIGHPYGLDYGEAPLVDQALRLAAGKTLYRSDLSSPPYTISNYPPLYVLALTPFVALWGPNYWGGRLLSTLSALATALFLGLMVYRAFRQRLAALLTASIFCVIPYVSGWSSLLRIDLLALALSTAALYVLMVAPARRAQLVAGAVLLTAAAYTRQSYALAAPLAGFVWLWTQAGRKPAFKLAGLVASMGLLLFVLLNVTTDGGFYFNVVTANVNEFGWERLGRHLSALWSTLPVLAAIGALALAVLPVARAHFWPLVVAYSVGAFLSSLTIGKIGSNVNYFMELCAALSLATGML
ncbi:MAG: glycosyltransferase family 39 protein, partial [Anaerolineae bacterium]|nr:glycosyltransferase family 39 protein [Anaerolineae bacterium]